jgi:hypothetical protein
MTESTEVGRGGVRTSLRLLWQVLRGGETRRRAGRRRERPSIPHPVPRVSADDADRDAAAPACGKPFSFPVLSGKDTAS